MARIEIDKFLIKPRITTRYRKHRINRLRRKLRRLVLAYQANTKPFLDDAYICAINMHKKAIRLLGKKG